MNSPSEVVGKQKLMKHLLLDNVKSLTRPNLRVNSVVAVNNSALDKDCGVDLCSFGGRPNMPTALKLSSILLAAPELEKCVSRDF